MSKEAQSHELTYDLIKRAVHGDQEAIEAYLRYYDAYINSLVMYDEVGPDSQIHSYIDEDITSILLMYRPLLLKYAVINGRLDEDLYQELCITLMRAIDLFRI